MDYNELKKLIEELLQKLTVHFDTVELIDFFDILSGIVSEFVDVILKDQRFREIFGMCFVCLLVVLHC